MIDEGTTAPAFELPALVDGDYERVALEEHLGHDVVILAFYPADFNPACDVESDLDQLDLFTMQQDVAVLAVGPDTLFAHEAFAEEYDLHIPLLADTKREAAEAYDVAYEDRLGQSLIARAVFVIDHGSDIVYAWSSRDPASRVNVDEVKDALGDAGGDDTALSRYRVGHAHYVEGRRAFTSAMDAYGESDWMLAQSDFKRAREEFEEAEQHFASAVRFVADALQEEHYDAAKEKATALWQAADWLGRSASEYSSGAGAAGKGIREDAERPLEEARAIAAPLDPDEWPPEEPPERDRAADDRPEYLIEDDESEPAALGVDIDEEGDADAGTTTDADAASAGAEADAGAGGNDESRGGPVDVADGGDAGDDAGSGGDDIDDDELAEIEAEIAASGPDEPLDQGAPEERRSVVDEPPADADEPPADVDAGDGASGEARALGEAGEFAEDGEDDGADGSDGFSGGDGSDDPDDDLDADLGAVETDRSGAGASLEPADGEEPTATGGTIDAEDDTADAADRTVDSDAGPADAEASEPSELEAANDELGEVEPESTSLEGIPSEEELAAEGGSDESTDAEDGIGGAEDADVED